MAEFRPNELNACLLHVCVCFAAQATPAGLTEAEATERLAEFGPNKLPETSTNPILS
jgi:hypothetical protein